MYNEKLEALIEAALTDGVLTAKEKQVLYKKAQALGVDLDEFEMVLNSRLAKVEKEEQKQANANAPKTSYRGERRTCPNCKALVGELDMRCPYCGYELTGGVNLTTKTLQDKLEKITQEYDPQIKKAIEDMEPGNKVNLIKQKVENICQAITATTIPTTKADLFEFATTMQANMLNKNIYKAVGSAYFSKYEEAMLKIKALFTNDPMFAELIALYDKKCEQFAKVNKSQKRIPINIMIVIGVAAALFVVVFAILAACGVMG